MLPCFFAQTPPFSVFLWSFSLGIEGVSVSGTLVCIKRSRSDSTGHAVYKLSCRFVAFACRQDLLDLLALLLVTARLAGVIATVVLITAFGHAELGLNLEPRDAAAIEGWRVPVARSRGDATRALEDAGLTATTTAHHASEVKWDAALRRHAATRSGSNQDRRCRKKPSVAHRGRPAPDVSFDGSFISKNDHPRVPRKQPLREKGGF